LDTPYHAWNGAEMMPSMDATKTILMPSLSRCSGHRHRPCRSNGIAKWLDVLKADHRAIFTAPSPAQRATDFINGLQPGSGA
jgi:antirestriction protein ArdC